MNKALKQQWVEALRSGKYKQARGMLRDPKEDSFCCIGILGLIQGIDPTRMDNEATCVLPSGDSAGLDFRVADRLAIMNDNGNSFLKIADHIEENL